MGIARSNLFYFVLYRPGILTYSALAIGVEKDAFEEDKAFGHMAKIWLSGDAIHLVDLSTSCFVKWCRERC